MWRCAACRRVYYTSVNSACPTCSQSGNSMTKNELEEKFREIFENNPPPPIPPVETVVSDIGVIVGRFQSPYLHAGYKELIQFAQKRHRRVFVFLGVSPLKATMHDPFDFKIRFDMISTMYPNLEIFKIDDVGDVERWSKNLDQQIALLSGPRQSVTLYGSRDCFPYSGRYEREIITPTNDVSATQIRQETGITSINSEEFRKGVIWATQNRWPICYPTVDVAVVDFKNNRLLFGKKPGETLWRFPGGFADVNSDSYEEDAIRELREETGLIGKSMEYIGSKKMDDWRYRYQVDKIKTLFYAVTAWEGEPAHDDDLAEVGWLSLDKTTVDDLVPTHRPLFVMFLNWRQRLVRLTQNKKSS